MRRLSSGCSHFRASICLLAGGAPADQESASLKSHLATCEGCQKYYEEVNSVATTLTNWEKSFCQVEPNQTVQARWAKDFQAVTGPARAPWSALIVSILDWCRDLFRPCRRIWAGFAAIWLGIFAINVSTRDTTQSAAIKRSPASPEAVRAFLEREGLLVELRKPGEPRVTEPPKPSLPAPRSERRPGLRRV
jgi:hypothetical protein